MFLIVSEVIPMHTLLQTLQRIEYTQSSDAVYYYYLLF